jgi:hypothetical protein
MQARHRLVCGCQVLDFQPTRVRLLGLHDSHTYSREGGVMLAAWTEILPLFVVRWLAIKHCERVHIDREGKDRLCAVARPDVFIRIARMTATPTAPQTKEG